MSALSVGCFNTYRFELLLFFNVLDLVHTPGSAADTVSCPPIDSAGLGATWDYGISLGLVKIVNPKPKERLKNAFGFADVTA